MSEDIKGHKCNCCGMKCDNMTALFRHIKTKHMDNQPEESQTGILTNANKFSTYFGSSKVKVGVLRPVQQPGSYWDRSSVLPLVGLEPTEATAYD